MPVRHWLHDLGLALRGVRRAKAFYATAVVTLAVGIAGATVMFTLIRGILLRPLPVPDEDRLVVSWRLPPSGPASTCRIDRRTSTRSPATVVPSNASPASATTAHSRRPGRTARGSFRREPPVVMGGFFAVAGVPPLLGQALTRVDPIEVLRAE